MTIQALHLPVEVGLNAQGTRLEELDDLWQVERKIIIPNQRVPRLRM